MVYCHRFLPSRFRAALRLFTHTAAVTVWLPVCAAVGYTGYAFAGSGSGCVAAVRIACRTVLPHCYLRFLTGSCNTGYRTRCHVLRSLPVRTRLHRGCGYALLRYARLHTGSCPTHTPSAHAVLHLTTHWILHTTAHTTHGYRIYYVAFWVGSVYGSTGYTPLTFTFRIRFYRMRFYAAIRTFGLPHVPHTRLPGSLRWLRRLRTTPPRCVAAFYTLDIALTVCSPF